MEEGEGGKGYRNRGERSEEGGAVLRGNERLMSSLFYVSSNSFLNTTFLMCISFAKHMDRIKENVW